MNMTRKQLSLRGEVRLGEDDVCRIKELIDHGLGDSLSSLVRFLVREAHRKLKSEIKNS